MTFEVKTRNAKGGIEYIRIEAEDRSALFAELKNRGLSAVSVEAVDGKAKPRKSAKAAGVGGGRPVSGVMKGVLALVVVCVIGAVVWLCVSKDEPKNPVDEVSKPRKMVPSQTPGSISIVRRQTEGEELRQTNAVKVEHRELPPSKPDWIMPDGKVDMDKYVSPDPGFSNRWERFKAEQAELPFKRMSENEIAVVLQAKPGEMVLDTAFHPDFVKDFLESLETPIVLEDDDDAERRQLKLDMIEAKKVLKEAYDRGEDIQEILRTERKELDKAYQLRENLMVELRKIQSESTSLQEVNDYEEAANKMLDEYGATHIRLPYSRDRLRLIQAEVERQ